MAKVAAGSGSSSRWSLSGLTALVTGGTRGIGHAIVEELAELGATVYTCSGDEAELNQRLQEWATKGLQVKGSVCDASTNREQRIKLMDNVSSAFNGKLNMLINNVGTNPINKPATEYTGEEYAHILSVNLDSAFHLCQLAHPLLKASGNGSIVFVSSVSGLVSVPYSSIYGATKGAVNSLTRHLACEWAKDNIRVNSVALWFTKTPPASELLENKTLLDNIIARTPLRRPGEAHEVSSLIAYFCLPGATYITGQVIAADGGFTVNGFEMPSF